MICSGARRCRGAAVGALRSGRVPVLAADVEAVTEPSFWSGLRGGRNGGEQPVGDRIGDQRVAGRADVAAVVDVESLPPAGEDPGEVREGHALGAEARAPFPQPRVSGGHPRR